MAPVDFKSIFSPRAGSERPRYPIDFISTILKDSFKFSTILLLGAVAQAILFAILPANYAIVPPAILALNALITTIFQTTQDRNSFNKNVIFDKTSAQLPDQATGRHGSLPAAQPIVVFHLGVRYNHPLGMLAPGGRELGDFFISMNRDLVKRAGEYGVLHNSFWRGTERSSNNTLLSVYYFRDIDGLNRFAHGPLHRRGWDWYDKAGVKNVGVFHEVFCAPPQSYESVYRNCSPTLMGAIDLKCQVEDIGEEAWVNSLVDAKVGPLRGQFSRMGRAVKQAREDN